MKKNILTESIISSLNESEGREYDYMMLNRLKSDCDYFLGHGNRNERHLWAHGVEAQINKMREIYNSFSDEDKPEWLTAEQIDEYERKMLSNEDNGEEYHIENPTVIEDKSMIEAEEVEDKEKLEESFIYTNTEDKDANLRLDVTDKLVGVSHGEIVDFGKVVGFNKINDTTYLVIKDGDKLYAYSIATDFPYVFNFEKSDEFAD